MRNWPMDELADIRHELAALRADNQQLRAEVGELRAGRREPESSLELDASVSRRGLMSKAAVVAAGAVAGAAMLGKPAAASDVVGDLVPGYDNFTHFQTTLKYTAALDNNSTATTGSLITTDSLLVLDSTASPLASSTGLECHGGGTGIHAFSVNVAGDFTGGAIGLQASGARPLAFVAGHGAPGAPIDVSAKGQFAFDSLGNLFYCIANGSPGVFRKLVGPETAGSLHLLPQPIRVFDSRPGLAPLGTANGGPKGIIASGATVAVNCTANSSGVPTDATGVSFNLTITQTVAGGYLTTWGGGTQPASSSINWTSSGADVANGVTIACDANAMIHVAAGGPGSTHFIVDVTGYYR
jgi:hypothetical protein